MTAMTPEAANRFDVYTSTDISGVVVALEQAWRQIRTFHPEVPAAVVIVGQGDGNRRLVWGHFAPSRWKRSKQGVHEIMIAGESLARPAAATIGTLLHEAAHALAEARGIKDTSRKGRYHNRRYKAIAEELGLDVELLQTIGWSGTTVRPATAKKYAAEITALDAAQAMLRAFRSVIIAEEDEKPRASRLKLVCACPRAISVAPGVHDEGPILCGVCDEKFVDEASAKSHAH